MDKTGMKIYGSLTASAVFAGGIAWISSAPWWVILIASIGAPALLIFFFFVIVANELAKNI